MKAFVSLVLLLAATCDAFSLRAPALASTTRATKASQQIFMSDDNLPPDVTTSKRPLWMPPEKTAEEKERDEANNPLNADFELDATTITALLGAAIAFQFFVLANL